MTAPAQVILNAVSGQASNHHKAIIWSRPSVTGSGVNEEVSALSEEGSQLHKEEDAALLEDEDACNQLQRPLDLDPLLSPADEQEEEALRCVEQGSQPRDILKTDSGQASRTGAYALAMLPVSSRNLMCQRALAE